MGEPDRPRYARSAPPLDARRQPAQSQSRETVAKIREAAARIIETEGLPRLNSNRIAEVAGVSVGTLYKFFPNKQAVLASVLAEWNAEVERAQAELARLNPTATLAAKMEDWFRHMTETSAAHVLVTSKVLQFYPELQAIDQARRTRAVSLIIDALRRDGSALDDSAMAQAASWINELGSYLLIKIMDTQDEAREALMGWSLMVIRAAIADAMTGGEVSGS